MPVLCHGSWTLLFFLSILDFAVMVGFPLTQSHYKVLVSKTLNKALFSAHLLY
jgi:hypothetical protein